MKGDLIGTYYIITLRKNNIPKLCSNEEFLLTLPIKIKRFML